MNIARTLIVSTADSSASLLEMILKQVGHDVLIATDAAQATQSASQTRIDLLLVEPRRSGLSAVEMVNRFQTAPGLEETPVIVVTQSDRDDELEKALAAGADDYLCAPFSPSVVMARVNAVLRTSRARQEMLIARQRYHVAARAAECGLWEWDIVHDRLYLTKPLQEMLMLGGPLPGTFEALLEMIHPQDRQLLRNAAREHLGGYTDLLDSELRIPSSAEPERWFLCRGQAFRSATGWAERVVGAFVDISARKSMENALRDSLRELATAKASIEQQARQLTQQNDLLHEVRVELERKSIQLELHNRELQQAALAQGTSNEAGRDA
ncbi:MAG: response regulator [Pirellulaceae bacterium]